MEILSTFHTSPIHFSQIIHHSAHSNHCWRLDWVCTDTQTDRQTDRQTSHMGMMRHIVAVVRIAVAIISIWRHRHPISVARDSLGPARPRLRSTLQRWLLLPQLRRRCRGRKFADFSTLKPYLSYNSWSNLLIFGYNTVHRHMRRLTSVFFDLCPNVQMVAI